MSVFSVAYLLKKQHSAFKQKRNFRLSVSPGKCRRNSYEVGT